MPLLAGRRWLVRRLAWHWLGIRAWEEMLSCLFEVVAESK